MLSYRKLSATQRGVVLAQHYIKARKHIGKRALLLVITIVAGALVSFCSMPEPVIESIVAPQPVTVQPSSSGTSGNTTNISLRIPNIQHQVEINQFSTCDSLLDFLKTEGSKRVGAYGFSDANEYWGVEGIHAFPDSGVWFPQAEDARTGAITNASASDFFSTTNVQVAGIEEADFVKTDGRRIVGITDGEFWVVDTTTNPPRKTGGLVISGDYYYYTPYELFLYEDKVLLINTAHDDIELINSRLESDVPELMPRGKVAYSSIIEIDISGDEPQILNELVIQGQHVSARRVGNTVTVVRDMGEFWNLPFVYPSNDRAISVAIDTNRQVIEKSTLRDWLPHYYLIDETAGQTEEGILTACDDILVPSEFSGFGGLLSVMTLDMEQGLDNRDVTAILGGGNTIYSSGDALYVTRTSYSPTNSFIQLYKFSTPEGAPARYEASGVVAGYHLLNQFAMHETPDGHFWIVTTVVGSENAETEDTRTETFVTSFRQQDDELVQVGSVGNLGKNETVYSVRFVGSKAYVVTFRQIDPFYVVDLSDPEDPAVKGELKIPGFSSYLHPLGNDLLLGIGQDATTDGEVTSAKLSLFDASDPTNPLELAVLKLDRGFFDAEWDHRAFLYWAPENLLVLPFKSYDYDNYNYFSGAIALSLDLTSTTDPFTRLARFQHISSDTEDYWDWDWDAGIRRSIVIDDDLWTVANGSLESRSIANLKKMVGDRPDSVVELIAP